MYLPVDGSLIYQVYNVECWTKQGTAFIIGGGFLTILGVPSQQLLASTNTTRGYYNGQMLAYASGVVSGGGSSGLTAGAIINLDPSSPSGDTGQKKWNGLIICDPALKYPLPLITPGTSNTPFVPLNTIQVASPLQGWVIRQQYLYASGTPSTDGTIVNTAVIGTIGINVAQSQIMNSSNANEVIFAY